jgi:hypothetical protein
MRKPVRQWHLPMHEIVDYKPFCIDRELGSWLSAAILRKVGALCQCHMCMLDEDFVMDLLPRLHICGIFLLQISVLLETIYRSLR